MRALLGLVLVLALAGCGSEPDLDGRTFVSTSVEGHDLVDGTSIQLGFEDGSMSANAGCNTTSGSYEVDDGTLRWTGPAASTLIGCPEDQAAQDDWLTQLLTDGVDVEQDGDTLTLTDDDVEIVLEAE